MPIRKNSYADMNKFLKTRNLQRKRYYQKTAFKYGRRRWTQQEDDLVLKREMTDMQLSDLIHRSVGAIQSRRTMLNKSRNIK